MEEGRAGGRGNRRQPVGGGQPKRQGPGQVAAARHKRQTCLPLGQLGDMPGQPALHRTHLVEVEQLLSLLNHVISLLGRRGRADLLPVSAQRPVCRAGASSAVCSAECSRAWRSMPQPSFAKQATDWPPALQASHRGRNRTANRFCSAAAPLHTTNNSPALSDQSVNERATCEPRYLQQHNATWNSTKLPGTAHSYLEQHKVVVHQ